MDKAARDELRNLHERYGKAGPGWIMCKDSLCNAVPELLDALDDTETELGIADATVEMLAAEHKAQSAALDAAERRIEAMRSFVLEYIETVERCGEFMRRTLAAECDEPELLTKARELLADDDAAKGGAS